MKPYTDLKGLEDIVLEESYVLAITATPGQVVFTVDFVLTPDHPHYRPKRPDEFACFRRGELRFQDIKILYWTGHGAPPAEDATGELDYGHIETFQWEPASYQLLGDWGYMEVTGGTVQVTIDNAESRRGIHVRRHSLVRRRVVVGDLVAVRLGAQGHRQEHTRR